MPWPQCGQNSTVPDLTLLLLFRYVVRPGEGFCLLWCGYWERTPWLVAFPITQKKALMRRGLSHFWGPGKPGSSHCHPHTVQETRSTGAHQS